MSLAMGLLIGTVLVAVLYVFIGLVLLVVALTRGRGIADKVRA